jgi:two-component system sensor histidine kinase AtoS
MGRPRSLRTQFLGGTLLVIAVVMTAVMVVVESHQRAAIVGEMRHRGEGLARNLAAMSYGPLLLYNFTALEQNVARVGAEADVVYAMVLDARGEVAAHNRRPDRVGVTLEGEVDRRAVNAETALVQESSIAAEPVLDFAVPVTVGQQRWGTVRVGVSRRRMEREIWRTRQELGTITVLTLLLGGVAAALMARRIAGPVGELARGAAAISRGEFNQRIEPSTEDEIGRLATAFNEMATQLAQQRATIEDANAELRRRLEEVADLKSYTDNVLRSLTSGILTVDLEGRVVTLNPAAELLTGYFAGEAIGRYCTEVFAHAPEIGEVILETLNARSVVPAMTFPLRRRNGTTLPVEFSAAPLRAGEGKELGAIGLFRDLSAVRRLEDQLRRSDRLAELGTLAAGIAHEIRNPLTSLLTFGRHLGKKFEDPQFRERFQSVVPRELERINAIVEGLLDLARPPRLALGRVRLAALLERVVELYVEQIETQGVTVVREFAHDVPTVVADGDQLYQALVNVVANALDAMPTGGRLSLRVGWPDSSSPRLSARRGHPDQRVRVEIADTGPGIPGPDADRVFNPFFTTKEQGTGLGLALTHKIIEDHGGTIDFSSAPASGTTFRIVLPLIPDLPDPEARRDDELG